MKRLILPFLLLTAFFSYSGKAQQNCGLSVQGIVTNPSCSGGMDGAIRLQVSGGAKPYTFHWNSGQQVQEISQLTEGTYRVRVRDSEGCEVTGEFSLKTDKKDLGLKIVQQPTETTKKRLLVEFPGKGKPYALYIQALSDGFNGRQVPYTGQTLDQGIYQLEAFTESGCSVLKRVVIEAN